MDKIYKIKEYQNYESDSEEEIKEKKYKSSPCWCGGRWSVANKSRHEKTKQHIKWKEQLDNFNRQEQEQKANINQ
jgi:hypothetical protein